MTYMLGCRIAAMKAYSYLCNLRKVSKTARPPRNVVVAPSQLPTLRARFALQWTSTSPESFVAMRFKTVSHPVTGMMSFQSSGPDGRMSFPFFCVTTASMSGCGWTSLVGQRSGKNTCAGYHRSDRNGMCSHNLQALINAVREGYTEALDVMLDSGVQYELLRQRVPLSDAEKDELRQRVTSSEAPFDRAGFVEFIRRIA